MIGITITALRRATLLQALGLLVAENGVATIATAARGGVPLLIELGALFRPDDHRRDRDGVPFTDLRRVRKRRCDCAEGLCVISVVHALAFAVVAVPAAAGGVTQFARTARAVDRIAAIGAVATAGVGVALVVDHAAASR